MFSVSGCVLSQKTAAIEWGVLTFEGGIIEGEGLTNLKRLEEKAGFFTSCIPHWN